jgi:hypothetical protein
MKPINKLVRDIQKNRHKILEDFSKAYLAETGLKPSQVILCESFDGSRYKWWFKKKRTSPADGKEN